MAKTLTVYLAADLKKFNDGMDQASRKAQGLGGTMSSVLGPALIGAAAAAGAFATKLAVDGVNAAIEDEAAAAKLAQTLGNLGLAHDTQPVEDYISTLERSLGIADDELRPAYDRLVRSIGNTEDANKALSLALDVSAGSGKSLDAVVQALGKAYDGNVAGLSRLGAGIDAAVLKTGNMDAITAQLAQTFGGQAATQAGTFQGQLDRLSVAAGNLQEAFGYGLLGSLEDTDAKTTDLVQSMEDLEPVLEAVGSSLGTFAGDVAYLAGKLTVATDAAQGLQDSLGPLGDLFGFITKSPLTNLTSGLQQLEKVTAGTADDFAYTQYEAYGVAKAFQAAGSTAASATGGINALTGSVDASGAEASDTAVRYLSLAEAINAAAGDTFNWRREVSGATPEAQNLGIELNYNAWVARQNAAAAAAASAATKNLGGSSSSTASSTEILTKAEKALQEQYKKQQETFDATSAKLTQHKADLEAVTAAANDYADSIRSSLQSALDLGKVYEGQFNDQGEKTGLGLLAGFQQQVDQAEWFGNVLGALKAQGADPGFLQAIAEQGAGIGGALGQQILDEGLTPTLSEKWVGVQNKINELTAPLIPEFLQLGIATGTELVTGLAEQLDREGKTLAKLGKQIAKPVGANFKAQLAADVADAIRNVEAAATAARAEKVAQAEAEAARLTEQAVAQALGRLVKDADARTGRNVKPVLA